MNNQKRKKIEQINKDDYDNSLIAMNSVFRKQGIALNELHSVIGLIYVHYALNGLLKLNNVQKKSAINQIDKVLQKDYTELGNSEESKVTDILKQSYTDVYTKTADLLNEKPELNPKQVDDAIYQPIDDEMYSKRIWDNKQKLIDNLKKAIDDILSGDKTIDEAAKEIENIFDVTAYESKRLLETELARTQARATLDLSKELGIKKLMWSATFENSCKKCMALDGKIFDIDKVPDLPQHPNCKCLLLPYIE